MMNPYVLIVIGLCRRRLAANHTLKRTFTGMRPFVLLQIVRPMEDLAAVVALELLRILVLPGVPQPIVFAGKLQATVIAGVRFYRFVCIDMSRVVGLANECLWAKCAPEWFGRATGMNPLVLFQIPFRGERLVADRACEFDGAVRLRIGIVRDHV